jgi:predicted GNAT family N-acyltransferase
LRIKDAREFVERHHYLGAKRFRCSYAFGLFDDGDLIGACVFHGISAPETAVGAFGLARTDQDGLWELGRLVLRADKNGQNRASFFVRRAIKELRKLTDVRAMISYADSSLHSGTVYKAAGFIYCGLTDKKCDFVVSGKTQERGSTRGKEGEWKPRTRKHRFILVFDTRLTLRWKVFPSWLS